MKIRLDSNASFSLSDFERFRKLGLNPDECIEVTSLDFLEKLVNSTAGGGPIALSIEEIGSDTIRITHPYDW